MIRPNRVRSAGHRRTRPGSANDRALLARLIRRAAARQSARAAVLARHRDIRRRFRDEGAGAVVQDARQNAADAERVLARYDPWLAAVLMDLGAICDSVGEIAEGEAADLRALRILELADAPAARIQLAGLLGNLAVRADGRLTLDLAVDLRVRALTLLRAVLPEQDIRVRTAVQNLAASWESRGDGAAADRVLGEHDLLARESGGAESAAGEPGPRPEALPAVLNLIATRLQRAGSLDAAEHFFRAALGSVAVRKPGQLVEQAAACRNLALLLELRGRFDESGALYRAALDALDTADPDDAAGRAEPGDESAVHRLRLQIANNLGYLQYRRGDLRSAVMLLEWAVAGRRALLGEQDPGFAESVNNLGLVQASMGNLAKAFDLVQLGYEIHRRQPSPELFDSMNNLAGIARAGGWRERARQLYEEALRGRRNLYGDSHPLVAESLNNLGVTALADGDTGEAEQLLREALRVRRAVYGAQHPEVVASMVNLANACMAGGDLDQARELLDAAWLTHLLLDPEAVTPRTGAVLFGIANLAMLAGERAAAVSALEAALDHESGVTGRILGLGSERERMQRLTAVRGHVDALVTVALEHTPDPAELVDSVYRRVLHRKAMGLRFIDLQRAVVTADRRSAQEATVVELVRARAEFGRGVLDGMDPAEQAALQARVEILEADLARSLPEDLLAESGGLEPADVLRAVRPGEVLVDLLRSGVWDPWGPFEAQWPRDRYVAFVSVGGRSALHLVDLGDAAAIDDAVAAHHAAVVGVEATRQISRDPVGARDETGCGDRLRRLVFDPLRPLFGDDVTRVLVAPDGMLNLVSFGALPAGDTDRLINSYEFGTLTSPLDMLQRVPAPAAAGGPRAAVVLGDPDYDLRGGQAGDLPGAGAVGRLVARGLPDPTDLRAALTELPGTREETARVAEILGVEPITGAEADKQRLAGVRNPAVLHLATHGFFLASGPGELRTTGAAGTELPPVTGRDPLLRCGLALAGAGRWLETGEIHPQAGDGFLTGLDVLGLVLDGTELVVLSACDTARGEIVDGEGVLGMGRAFLSAGARNVVMSLWKVPDSHTATLMVAFYERLREGDEIPTALRRAQLAVRADAAAPFYWGAFVCHGSGAGLSGASTPGR